MATGQMYKRAWIQRRENPDKDWANCRRYLNVARVDEPCKGPKGNATDFRIFNDLLDQQILGAFVRSICAMTGVKLDSIVEESEARPRTQCRRFSRRAP